MHKYKPLDNDEVPSPNDLHFLKVKDSPIQGRGLFTETDLNAGSVLFKLKGDKVRHEYRPDLALENPNWIGTGYGEWLRLAANEVSIYINHSCKPNVIISENLNVITLCTIKAHEELLLDYSTTELDPFWQMDCCCSEDNCRKILRAYPFIPDELKARYGKFLSHEFSAVAEEVMVEKT